VQAWTVLSNEDIFSFLKLFVQVEFLGSSRLAELSAELSQEADAKPWSKSSLPNELSQLH
jgi:hypothetical protein